MILNFTFQKISPYDSAELLTQDGCIAGKMHETKEI